MMKCSQQRVVRSMRISLFLSTVALLAGVASPISAQTESPRPLFARYCVTCHNQKSKTAGLELDKLDPAQAADHPEPWEKVIRKLRAGMMPPAGMPRPEPAALEQAAAYLENQIDRAARPHLTAPAVHRVNRTEYA